MMLQLLRKVLFSLCILNIIIRVSAIGYGIFNVQDYDDFKNKVLNSEVPVVVDFNAGWCGPCKILKPRLEKIVGGQNGKVDLAKVDIDSIADIASEYGVETVPSVLAMKNGKVVDKFIGVQDEDQIRTFVEKLLAF